MKNYAKNSKRWIRIQAFLQEAGLVIDYLHWRVVSKIEGTEQPASPIYGMTADEDGLLTEDGIVKYLRAIARQARAGFVDGPDFPVFLPIAGRLGED